MPNWEFIKLGNKVFKFWAQDHTKKENKIVDYKESNVRVGLELWECERFCNFKSFGLLKIFSSRPFLWCWLTTSATWWLTSANLPNNVLKDLQSVSKSKWHSHLGTLTCSARSRLSNWFDEFYTLLLHFIWVQRWSMLVLQTSLACRRLTFSHPYCTFSNALHFSTCIFNTRYSKSNLKH